MTREIETTKLPALQAGGSVKAIVPQDFDGAWRIASAVTKAGMAPKGLDTPEKAMVAIMHGMEVGLTPMAALQSIAVVNGRPTIWGDGAIGIVRGSGKCEWIREKIEGDGNNMVAICQVKRKGEPEPIAATFSVADAIKASLWGKAGPWVQYPKRMLAMRARAFALRDGFADVLRGLGIAEEVQDITPMKDVTPPRQPAPPAETAKAPPPPPAEDEAITIDKDPAEFDDTSFFQALEDDMATATDMPTIDEIWDMHAPEDRFAGKENGETNLAIAKAIRNRAEGRVK